MDPDFFQIELAETQGGEVICSRNSKPTTEQTLFKETMLSPQWAEKPDISLTAEEQIPVSYFHNCLLEINNSLKIKL